MNPSTPQPQVSESIALEIVKQRTRGVSWANIADRFQISTEQVFTIYKAYAESQPILPKEELRVLQMDRLDAAIDMLWDAASRGDVESSRHLLTAIKEVGELADLYKAKTQTIINVVDQRQITLITNYVEALSDTLLHKVLHAVRTNTTDANNATELIEQNWHEWVAEASEKPLKEIEADQVTIDV